MNKESLRRDILDVLDMLAQRFPDAMQNAYKWNPSLPFEWYGASKTLYRRYPDGQAVEMHKFTTSELYCLSESMLDFAGLVERTHLETLVTLPAQEARHQNATKTLKALLVKQVKVDQTETLRAQVKEILKDAVERFPRALVDHHVPFDRVSEPLSYSHNRDYSLLWAHIDHRYSQYNLVEGLTLQMGGTNIPLDELNLLGLKVVVEALPGFLAEVRKREAKIVETYYMGESCHVSHVVDNPQVFQKATEQLSALKEAMAKESDDTVD